MTWRRKDKPPAQASPPAPGTTPVPGHLPLEARPSSPPWGPSPAPGSHDAQLECVTRDYTCGCRHYHDPTGRLIAVVPCRPDEPDLIDLEYRAVCAEEDQ